jgi:hypothetical protein
MLSLLSLFARLVHFVIAFPSLAESEAGTGPVLFSFPIYRVDGRRHLEFRGRTVRVPLTLAVLSLFAMIWLLNVAASGNAASVANALAGLAIILSPLALKYVKLDGPTMVAVSYLTALVIAAAALLLSGEAKFDPSSTGSVLAFTTALFGLQQIVFQVFKDHPLAGPLLK